MAATGHPIHFMFGSMVWCSGTANLTASFKFTTDDLLLPWQRNLRQKRL